MKTSPRCWAGYHGFDVDGCATSDCTCWCHAEPAATDRPAAAKAPAAETANGTAPEDCGALTSGHETCPGECDGCHVHGRRSYANEAL